MLLNQESDLKVSKIHLTSLSNAQKINGMLEHRELILVLYG